MIKYILIFLLLVNVFFLSAQVIDSVDCVTTMVSDDGGLKFTQGPNPKWRLNRINDNCVLAFVDYLMAHGDNPQCVGSLNNMISVSDGYLSEYLSGVLATSFLTNTSYFLTTLYKNKEDEKEKKWLLMFGLAFEFSDDKTVFEQVKKQKLSRKEMKQVRKIKQEVLEYLKLNPL